VTEAPAGTRLPVEIKGEPTALYRLYDASDDLLYIGITNNLAARFAQHAADKYWWPEVARKTAVLYGSREEALAEETRAIPVEQPVHNVAGREEKTASKQAVRLKSLADRAGRISASPYFYQFSREGLVHLDAYAAERKCSRDEAVLQLLFAALMKYYQDARAAIAAERAELEAVIAARATAAAS
jgi:predicted GIY-YIG superfamily endonuclease